MTPKGIWLTADGGDCTMRVSEAAVQLVFHPSGEEGFLALDDALAAELHRIVTERVGRVRLIRYRGELEPITIEDLSAFGAPILPEEAG